MGTLLESAKLALDELVRGVIANIITTNQMFELLPFSPIDGNALSYNREAVLGTVGVAGVGDEIDADPVNPIDSSSGASDLATWTNKTATLTKILGDAPVDEFLQATRSAYNDQTAVQVASKAKHLGRVYQKMLISGSGAGNQFEGLISLCASGQKVNTGVDGANFSFALLDELLDLIKDQDGRVDYIAMHSRTHRAYKAALRALGGASIDSAMTLPSGDKVDAYSGIPIFRNDWIPINVTKGSSTNTTSVFAGTFDDGSQQHGISGLTARNAAGIMVQDVGVHQNKDERITRVKWYCGLACFSELGLALMDGIKN